MGVVGLADNKANSALELELELGLSLATTLTTMTTTKTLKLWMLSNEVEFLTANLSTIKFPWCTLIIQTDNTFYLLLYKAKICMS